MEWFKHPTCSHDDPDISDAWDQFGDAGVAIFWTILELYGKEFRHRNRKGEIKLSKKYLQRILRKKWFTVEQVITHYSVRNRFYVRQNENDIYLKIPKFIDMASNWTRYGKTKPLKVPTKAPIKNQNVDKDKDKDIIKVEQTENRIADIATQISKSIPKSTFNPFQFDNKNKKKHPGARLHTMTRLLKEAKAGVLNKVSWQYAQSILDSEHKNYNERDAMGQHEKLKKEMDAFERHFKIR